MVVEEARDTPLILTENEINDLQSQLFGRMMRVGDVYDELVLEAMPPV